MGEEGPAALGGLVAGMGEEGPAALRGLVVGRGVKMAASDPSMSGIVTAAAAGVACCCSESSESSELFGSSPSCNQLGQSQLCRGKTDGL